MTRHGSIGPHRNGQGWSAAVGARPPWTSVRRSMTIGLARPGSNREECVRCSLERGGSEQSMSSSLERHHPFWRARDSVRSISVACHAVIRSRRKTTKFVSAGTELPSFVGRLLTLRVASRRSGSLSRAPSTASRERYERAPAHRAIDTSPCMRWLDPCTVLCIQVLARRPSVPRPSTTPL